MSQRQAERVLPEVVFHFIPQSSSNEALLHDLVQFGLAVHTQNAGPEGHVVKHRLGKRIGSLEDHSDPATKVHDVGACGVDVPVVQQDLALDPCSSEGVVHPVETAQEGGLAAARGTDERRDLAVADINGDVRQGGRVAVVESEVLNLDLAQTHTPCTVPPAFNQTDP